MNSERPNRFAVLLLCCQAICGIAFAFDVHAQTTRGYSIPVIDISAETDRQTIVDRDDGQYLGHPSTLLMEDGQTMWCAYPQGHGKGVIVLKCSTDAGRTWSGRLPTPSSWTTSLETPTLFRTIDAKGKRRMLLWSGLYPARLSVSEDDGAHWSELEAAGDWGGIVVMSSMIALPEPGHYLALFHDDGRFRRADSRQKQPVVFQLLQTRSRDGGVTWSQPECIQQSSDLHLCEPACLRSPDGQQLALLLRENSRQKNSHVMFSNDEGKSWSAAYELPGALTGDRHVARYVPDGRLFISFRDTTLSSNTHGDWVAWVGNYDDIVEGREGAYRIRIMDNHHAADCAYPGVEVLPDGTIVTTTYGHWTKDELPYIVSVRLRLDDSDKRLTGENAKRLARSTASTFPGFPQLDSLATGSWWHSDSGEQAKLFVPRSEVVAFALYTHDNRSLKLTAQLYPLLPDEPREAVLDLFEVGGWREAARATVQELGWSAHFRLKDWDHTRDVPYRVRHGTTASFTGTIRHDPIEQDQIVLAALSCNSNRTEGPRDEIVTHLQAIDPDLLFFAGDQTYHHTEHTYGWLEFGRQFRDIIRDRPTITIPDDHDIGQGNLWGESGKKAQSSAGNDGGYFYPAKYINMVQRCQTWHLPDPVDASPIERGIGVYFTRLRVGGVDFAVIEDRKFKSGPGGKIPKLGPRPDHISDQSYDPRAIDLPGLVLLGDRQLKFLRDWGNPDQRREMKCVLSQTAFAGAVHLHGDKNNRLLADLDCNGWPQSGRKRALELIQRAGAIHVCGDQHLAVLLKHGIHGADDGPYGFTVPAIVNSYYGRWWWPQDEQPGKKPRTDTKLPWTGNYRDGLGNTIRMLAYANPEDPRDPRQRGDGFGVIRFNKPDRRVTFECWPRFADAANQYPGWPVTISLD